MDPVVEETRFQPYLMIVYMNLRKCRFWVNTIWIILLVDFFIIMDRGYAFHDKASELVIELPPRTDWTNIPFHAWSALSPWR